jgi:hypothetical protein
MFIDNSHIFVVHITISITINFNIPLYEEQGWHSHTQTDYSLED